MPDREFFSVIATLAALVWVSLLVESQLHADSHLLERIKAVASRLKILDGRSQIIDRQVEELTRAETRLANLEKADAQLGSIQDRVAKQRDAVMAEFDRVRLLLGGSSLRYLSEFDFKSNDEGADGGRDDGDGQPADASGEGGEPSDGQPDQPDSIPPSGPPGEEQATPSGEMLSAPSDEERRTARADIGGFAATQARALTLISRGSDLELEGQFVAQHRMKLANMVTKLMQTRMLLAAQVAELAADERRLRRLQRLRVRLYRWLPSIVCVAGGWTEVVALVALYGQPSRLGAVLAIAGLAVLGTVLASVLMIRLAAMDDPRREGDEQNPAEAIGRVERRFARATAVVITAAPVVLAVVFSWLILNE